jgi:serine/threonine-protein kinase
MRLRDDRYLGDSDPDAMIGARVGPFTIVRLLGEGGMGKIYVAEHVVLETQRAVRLLSEPLTQNAVRWQRFLDEARAAAQLDHRNLIRVHDVGQLPSGTWFMVLDYLDGDTLGRAMATQFGAMPAHAIVPIVYEIANGLQVVHDHRIVHGDLKPESVFLVARDGDPRPAVVLDFGVALRGEHPAAGSGMQGGIVLGTPAYMPPEQLRGAPASPTADVFALGVIAYQMTTGGWFPYQYDESRDGYGRLGTTELYHRQMTGRPVDPRARCPSVTGAWASAILAAIHPDPAERPASARAFALRLADSVPPGGLAPEGLAIVRPSARELAGGGCGAAGPPAGDAARRLGLPAGVPDSGSRYQLGDKLGVGGMAEVFLGTMIGVEGFVRQVAIKRVLAGLSQVPTFAMMFVAEAQIAAQLTHPNIVSILDFSRDLEDRLFLVMEYIDGKDLASVLAAGPIRPSLAIFIVVEMLRGLGYAHELPAPMTGTRGVVHRDVSPQNLLVSYEGAVKVSDFGLAKARAASDGVWSGTVRGKPSYMSPEQVCGDVLDGRTDLYAVGVMLWEMLAGRPLFAGTANEITAQVIFKGIALPSAYGNAVPADLEAVAMKLLAHDRNDRYRTAEVAIEALLQCADVPRDGRRELASLLAERFPRANARTPRLCGPVSTGAPGARPVTVLAPPSGVAGANRARRDRPRRRIFAATLSGVVVGSLAAAAVIARSETARSGTTAHVVPAAALAHGEVTPVDAGVADAVRPPDAAHTAHPGERAPPRPPALHGARDHVTRTGELAIIVRPWALIWLNGRPSGQTPFRAVVPAGRYRVRLANDDVGRNEITIITVAPDQTATVERTW